MAKKTILIDDLDGSEDDVEVHKFSIDGDYFEIDLSSTNFFELEALLQKYVNAARQTRRADYPHSKRRVRGRNRDELRAIREWARANGWEVADRGAMPKGVLDAYQAAVNGV